MFDPARMIPPKNAEITKVTRQYIEWTYHPALSRDSFVIVRRRNGNWQKFRQSPDGFRTPIDTYIPA